ncbi:MAG: phosphoglycerate kinase, partial [Patescibacteria group bacterium]
MEVKSLKQIKELKGKRVLLRVDFNVPLGKDLKVDRHEDYRLVQTLPTLRHLMKKQARIIILSHLGRPEGKVVEGLRLDPVAKRLSQLLGKKVE